MSRIRRWIVRIVLAAVALALLAGAAGGGLWFYFHPRHTLDAGIVYGTRNGDDLTLDVMRPARPNGAGVLVMVSGGWKSNSSTLSPVLVAPLLRRGFTVIAVGHRSQPEATVMEIVDDVTRAVRFVRHHAAEFGISPDRLGVSGGSSGGHLSLMLAVNGSPGDPAAADPVARQSSAIQAVACFYPVTDLLNLGPSTENPGDGGPPKSFVRAFGPEATNLEAWKRIGRSVSPIYHVSRALPPILIIHGDADTLVPLDQSERFAARAREAGRTVELVVRPGKEHGWLTMVWDIRQFADWFEDHL